MAFIVPLESSPAHVIAENYNREAIFLVTNVDHIELDHATI